MKERKSQKSSVRPRTDTRGHEWVGMPLGDNPQEESCPVRDLPLRRGRLGKTLTVYTTTRIACSPGKVCLFCSCLTWAVFDISARSHSSNPGQPN